MDEPVDDGPQRSKTRWWIVALTLALMVVAGVVFIVGHQDPYGPGTTHQVTFRPEPPCTGPVRFTFHAKGGFYNFESRDIPKAWQGKRAVAGTFHVAGHWWNNLSPIMPKVRASDATFTSGGIEVHVGGGRGVFSDMRCTIAA